MTWTLLVPGAMGIVVALLSGRLQRRLQPSHAAATYAVLASVIAVAIVAFVTVVAVLFVSRLPFMAALVPWCRALAQRHDLAPGIGAAATITLAAMAASLAHAIRRDRRHRRLAPAGEAFVVLATDQPAAFAIHGDPGCIVVSAGMLRALDGPERRVLLAHERAHLDRHHHRYLQVTAMASAVVPFLLPLMARVRFATERWADEEAALAVGDRRLVARAICRAALAQDSYPATTMALASSSVVARVDALLCDQPAPAPLRRAAVLITTTAALATASLASSVQLHHLATFATHLCPLG